MYTFSVQLFYDVISIQWKYIAVRNNTDLSAGDVTVCPAGTGHSIANHSGDDVELIAVIVFA